jgi:hypothetical protein
MLRLNLMPIILLALATAACLDPTNPDTGFEADWAELGKACPVSAPAYTLPDAARDSLPSGGGEHRTFDEIWADFAREVPGGWGGMFYEQERLTMYLLEPSKRQDAIAALMQLLQGSGWEEVLPDLPSARVKQGRWDFAQLFDWYRYINQHVWRVEGVTVSDIQEQRNRLEYGAKDEDTKQRVTEVLTTLDLPCFLVAVEIRAPVVIGG